MPRVAHRHSSRILSEDTKKYCTQHSGFADEAGGEWIATTFMTSILPAIIAALTLDLRREFPTVAQH